MSEDKFPGGCLSGLAGVDNAGYFASASCAQVALHIYLRNNAVQHEIEVEVIWP
ncbi:MAG TPA: hypothetical protein VMZ06_16570 [Candidatus Bathyarchaeia archaeon]|nr:hypothetical protein [Candidatus Bathyarchaeia archaeon]